jgi:hypothetical protein
VLVHFLFAEVGHDAGLSIGGSFDGVVDDPVEVAVDSSLIHFDDFFVEALFSGSDDFFCVSPSCLFYFSVSSLIFCFFYFFFDFFLFGYSY